MYHPAAAFAAEIITVQNYFYAHANQPGTYYFKDKYNTDRQYGDNVQHDAVITAIRVSAQGMAAGDQIIVETGSGSTYPVTPGDQLNLNVSKSDYIRIKLVKSGFNEVFAKLDYMTTFDDSNGGTTVKYNFSVNDIPTDYGDLGPGSPGGGTDPGDPGDTDVIVAGTHYYFQPRDAYRYDYNPPSGVAYYQLHFDGANGQHYYRQYDQQPTGIHWLTCNGSYQMRFFNSAGQLVAKSPDMATGSIQNPVCNSQPGNDAGYNDLTASINLSGPVCSISWQGIYADTYEIYRDGQYVIAVEGFGPHGGFLFDHPIDCVDGAYSLLAIKDGQYVAQKDFKSNAVPPVPGGGGGGGGGTNPGGGYDDGCNGCKLITDLLACPAWDQYMGEWESMLRSVIPPAPNWQQVANIMRDTIVPAMGQELVNRAPVIADIIADEFESREDPVYPPGSIPAYNPPGQLPVMQDMTDNIDFDLSSDIPDFEPDFSGSVPFTIPDPLSIQLDDTDSGYNPPDPTPSNNLIPDYSGRDPVPERDPGYQGLDDFEDTNIPGYVITNPDANDPIRVYNPQTPGDSGQIPGYQIDDGAIDAPDYVTPDDPMPGYKIPD